MAGLKWDYHTHTTYSHGKGSIEDNVKVAVEKGLTEIAISDHGPGHIAYGIKRDKIQSMRGDIDAIKDKYPQIRIFLSVEANIINRSGALDLTPREWDLFDFVIAGYHYGAFGEQPGHDLGVHGKNWVLDKFHTTTKAMKNQNTELILKAIYENDIKIITHPGAKYEIDITEVAKACSQTGTWMEINNSHPYLTPATMAEAAQHDVTFVIGSDAHVPNRVGNFANALTRIEAAGIDKRRVVNLLIER